MREADHLEQPPHADAISAGQARERGVDLDRLGRWYRFAQHRRAALDAEVAQERGLLDRTENARSHALGRECYRLKVDMRSEVNGPRGSERIGVVVRANRLQGVAGGAFGVAVVDHQRGALWMSNAPAELERDIVGAPFKYFADLHVAQLRRQHLLEQRDGVARVAEAEPAALVELDHPLVPAVDAHHRLLDRQCVEELVGEDDRGARWDQVERLVPFDRHVAAANSAALPLFQQWADLDEMQAYRRAKLRHRISGAQDVEHHGAAAGTELDQVQAVRLAHQLPHRHAP